MFCVYRMLFEHPGFCNFHRCVSVTNVHLVAFSELCVEVFTLLRVKQMKSVWIRLFWLKQQTWLSQCQIKVIYVGLRLERCGHKESASLGTQEAAVWDLVWFLGTRLFCCSHSVVGGGSFTLLLFLPCDSLTLPTVFTSWFMFSAFSFRIPEERD